MQSYSINVNFILTGKAQERLEGQTIEIPSPPAGVITGFYPNIGDIISVSGLEAYTLVVVAREISFTRSSLNVKCILDTVVHDSPDLRLVK